MAKYIYEESDKEAIEIHRKNQESIPVYFHNSYSETCLVVAYRNILKMFDEGKTADEVKKVVNVMINSILSD